MSYPSVNPNSNPPLIIEADPSIDLSHLPASKHPPTIGPPKAVSLQVSI